MIKPSTLQSDGLSRRVILLRSAGCAAGVAGSLLPLRQAKELDMPAVTGVMLEELEARIADGFGHDLPVPFYRMPRGRFVREQL